MYLLELRKSEEALRSANQTLGSCLFLLVFSIHFRLSTSERSSVVVNDTEILASPFALGQRAVAFAQLEKHDNV
jgi:hypothetical protein